MRNVTSCLSKYTSHIWNEASRGYLRDNCRLVRKAKERQRNDATAASVSMSITDARSMNRAHTNRLVKRAKANAPTSAGVGAGRGTTSAIGSRAASVKSAPPSLKRKKSVQTYVAEATPTPYSPGNAKRSRNKRSEFGAFAHFSHGLNLETTVAALSSSHTKTHSDKPTSTIRMRLFAVWRALRDCTSCVVARLRGTRDASFGQRARSRQNRAGDSNSETST